MQETMKRLHSDIVERYCGENPLHGRRGIFRMETASACASDMTETLLRVIALASMHRASGMAYYRKSAAEWVPLLERQLSKLKEDLNSDQYDLPSEAAPVSKTERGN